MSDELTNLRAEVERLLANALRDDKRHVAEVERRDQLHIHELSSRNDLHVAEISARDGLHANELETLRVALESRDLMGQAKGVIMASMGCDAAEAFALIVSQSQHENRKAIDVAQEIVQRAVRRPSTPGGQM